MSKLRVAAVAASMALLASFAPATAAANPSLPWGSHGHQTQKNPYNKTKKCKVDWNTKATMDPARTPAAKIDGGVSPARGDNGVLEMQLFTIGADQYWRTVVATDYAITDFRMTVKLPAGPAYTTWILEETNPWFAVDELDNRISPVPWNKPLGPGQITLSGTDGTYTVTLDENTLPKNGRFVLTFWRPFADIELTATAEITGTFTDKKACASGQHGGNGSNGSLAWPFS